MHRIDITKGLGRRLFKAITVTTCALALFAQCTVVPPTTGGTVRSQAPGVIVDQGDCQLACGHMASMGCSQSQPVGMPGTCRANTDCKGPDGAPDQFQTCSAAGTCMVTCTNLCISTENNGVWLNPACILGITSCDQVDSCVTAGTGTSCTGASCKVAPSGKR